ncbi:MAG: hypothetical protein AAF892_01280 [Cyanobacteria bacterium P01_D01_bin.71]
MLLASVGLHGLVLFAPVGPSEDDILPAPNPEEDGIAVTKIPAPQPRAVAAPPANTGTVKTAPTAAPAPRTQAAASPAQTSNNSTAAGSSNPFADNSIANTDATVAVPDLTNPAAITNPNTDPPQVGGPSTSGNGRNPRPVGPDPFDEYIKIFGSYNGVKIAPEDAAETQTIWLESFSDRGPDFIGLAVEPIKISEPLPYEAEICLPKSPEPAQLLVMVDGDGTVDDYQPFMQRTGYRDFDNAAAEQVKQYDFPDANGPQAYQIEVAVDYDEDDCDWPPQVDKLPDEYFTVLDKYVGPELTTPNDTRTAQENWLKSLSDSEDLDLSNLDELTAEVFEGFDQEVPYPLEICLPIKPKDTAAFGVVVQADGSLGTEPVPLRSTGYKNFDDSARTLVENFDFSAAETTRLLVVEVPVDYNDVNCQPLDSDSFDVPTTTASAGSGADSSTADESSQGNQDDGEVIAFDPAAQTSLLEDGRQRVEAYPAGGLNTQMAIAAASLEDGWPAAVDQSCFLTDISTDNFVPVEAASDAVILSENAEFVPLTLSRLYQVEPQDAGEYCGAPLLQMAVNGTPQLFASTISFGSGGANTLVVLWTADPREN